MHKKVNDDLSKLTTQNWRASFANGKFPIAVLCSNELEWIVGHAAHRDANSARFVQVQSDSV